MEYTKMTDQPKDFPRFKVVYGFTGSMYDIQLGYNKEISKSLNEEELLTMREHTAKITELEQKVKDLEAKVARRDERIYKQCDLILRAHGWFSEFFHEEPVGKEWC